MTDRDHPTKRSRRLPAALAAGVLLVASFSLLGSCGPSDDPEHADRTPSTEGSTSAPVGKPVDPLSREATVVMRAGNRFATLNPALVTDLSAKNIIRFFLNMRLLEEEPSGSGVMPWLAKNLPVVTDGGRTHLWTIHEAATWRDGTPITSADAVFSWKLLLEISGGNAGELNDVTAVEAVDARSFKVSFKGFSFNSISRFGRVFNLLPASSTPDDRSTLQKERFLPGSGPYHVGEWTAEKLELIRHKWWGEKLPRFAGKFGVSRFVYRVVKDARQFIEQMRSGEMDVGAVHGFQDYLKLTDPPFGSTVQMAYYYLPRWSFIGWNCERAPVDDPRVRRALSHLMPRQAINQAYNDGYLRPISGPFATETPCSDATIQPHRLSQRTAAKLFEDAGWRDTDADGFLDKDGRKFTLSILWPTEGKGWAEPIVTQYSEQLKQAKLDVKFESLGFNDIVKRCGTHEFDGYLLLWGTEPIDPDVSDLYHSGSISSGGYNWQNYRNTEGDKALDAYRAEGDTEKRAAIARRIHRYLHEDQPMMFLFNSPSGVLWNRRVQGAKAHGLGLRQWDFRVESR